MTAPLLASALQTLFFALMIGIFCAGVVAGRRALQAPLPKHRWATKVTSVLFLAGLYATIVLGATLDAGDGSMVRLGAWATAGAMLLALFACGLFSGRLSLHLRRGVLWAMLFLLPLGGLFMLASRPLPTA